MDKATQLLLESIQDSVKQNREEVKSSFAAQTTVISARVDAKIDSKMGLIHNDIGKLLAHNEKQNGWIEEHKERLDVLDGENGSVAHLQANAIACKAHRSFFKKMGKNWRVTILLVVLVFFLLHSLFEVVNIGTLIELIIEKIF